MELLDAIVRIIQTVGFPIAMAIYLLWENHNTIEPIASQMAVTANILEQVQVKLEAIDRRLSND